MSQIASLVIGLLTAMTTPCPTEDSHRCYDAETQTVYLWHADDPAENDNVPTIKL